MHLYFFPILQLAILAQISATSETDTLLFNCSALYNSNETPNGYIISPNYPYEYPNNIRCVYDFQGQQNERVILNIEDFDLELPQLISVLKINPNNNFEAKQRENSSSSSTIQTFDEPIGLPQQSDVNSNDEEYSEITDAWQCYYDYLDVFSYDVLGFYRLRSRYCGKRKDLQIVSTSPNFRIIFETDRNMQFKGFKMRYHFSYLNILPFITYKICGDSAIEGDGGVLSSPNYPSTFPTNIECAWTITVETHKNILIKFVDINFNEPCHVSYVRIWDGYMDNPDKPDLIACQKLMYYLKGQRHFVSKTNRMVIKFNGNKASSTFLIDELLQNTTNVPNTVNSRKQHTMDSSKRGFLLTWTAIERTDECGGFQCNGGEICIDSKNLICQKTEPYCISNSLVCDGYSHCDVGDDSDESDCQFSLKKRNIFSWLIIVGLVAFTALSLFVCVCIYVVHLNRKKLEIIAAANEKAKTATLTESPEPEIKYYCAKPKEKIIKEDSYNRYVYKSSPNIIENPTNIQRKKDQVLFRIWKSDPMLYHKLLERMHLEEQQQQQQHQQHQIQVQLPLPPPPERYTKKSASQKRLSFLQAQTIDVVSHEDEVATLSDVNVTHDDTVICNNTCNGDANALNNFLDVSSSYRRNSYRKAIRF